MNTTAVITGLAIAVLPMSACGSVDVAPSPGVNAAMVNPLHGPSILPNAETPAAGPQWSAGPEGTALFAVGAHPRDGLASIPLGRYEVKVGPNARAGNWMLCDEAVCGPAHEESATVVGHAIAPYSSTIHVGPTARTLWIDNLILSPADVAPVPADAS